MTPAALLAELARLGVVITLDGDRLHYRAPPGALPQDLRRLLAAQKAGLAQALTIAPAHRAFEVAIDEVGRRWDRLPAPRPELPAEEDRRLEVEINDAFRGGDLEAALAGVAAWLAAWHRTMDRPLPGESRFAARGRCLAEEVDGLRPRRNQGVLDMFARPRTAGAAEAEDG